MDRKVAYIMAAAVGLMLMMGCHDMATAARGYEAIGGEHLFLTLPLWVWLGEMIALDR